MSNTPKRFEDFQKVECNECDNYWNDTCDGVPKDTEKPCNSFLATRSIVIPARLNDLEKCVKWLTVLVCILIGWNIGQLIAYLLRWF